MAKFIFWLWSSVLGARVDVYVFQECKPTRTSKALIEAIRTKYHFPDSIFFTEEDALRARPIAEPDE
jgi:hypothetical protein